MKNEGESKKPTDLLAKELFSFWNTKEIKNDFVIFTFINRQN